MSNPTVLIFGGTGSLGKTLLRHFISDYDVAVFSRDEAKHVVVKQLYPAVRSIIGDIRDRDAVFGALVKTVPDIVINAAALKNVPEVEEVPMEGVKTSLIGTDNLNNAVRALSMYRGQPMKVLTVSTDKACSPSNAYGMAKALQERLHIRSNGAGLVCNAVRYGNVLESRGSLIPLIKQRFSVKAPVFITDPRMTRFFLTLDASVDLIKAALADNDGGKLFVPDIRSARITDVIDVFRELYGLSEKYVQTSRIRPGEKIHESLISFEEARRTERCGKLFIIHDILTDKVFTEIGEPFSSGDPGVLMTREELVGFFERTGVLDDNVL